MGDFLGGLVLMYFIVMGVIGPVILLNAPVVIPRNWECTKSMIVKHSLPKEEVCAQWTQKPVSDSNDEQR